MAGPSEQVVEQAPASSSTAPTSPMPGASEVEVPQQPPPQPQDESMHDAALVAEPETFDGDDQALLDDAENADEKLYVPQDADYVFGGSDQYNSNPTFTFGTNQGVTFDENLTRAEHEAILDKKLKQVHSLWEFRNRKMAGDFAVQKQDFEDRIENHIKVESRLREQNKNLKESALALELQERIQQLQAAHTQIQVLQQNAQHFRDLERRMAEAVTENNSLRREKDEIGAANEHLKQQANASQSVLNQTNTKLQSARAHNQNLEIQVFDLTHAMDQQIIDLNRANSQLTQQNASLSQRDTELEVAQQQASQLALEKSDLEQRLNEAISQLALQNESLSQRDTELEGSKQQAAQLAIEKAELEARLNEANSQLTRQQASESQRDTELEDARQQASRLADEKAELERRLNEAGAFKQQNQKLSDLNSMLTEANKDLGEKNEALEQRLEKIKEEAEEQRHEQLDIIHHHEDKEVEYLDDIKALNASLKEAQKAKRHQEEQIEELNQDCALKNERIQSLEAEQADQKRKAAEAKSHEASNKLDFELLQEQVAKLERDIEDSKANTKKLQQDRAELEEECESLQEDLSKKTAEAGLVAELEREIDEVNELYEQALSQAAQAHDEKDLLERTKKALEDENLALHRHNADLETLIQRKDAKLEKFEQLQSPVRSEFPMRHLSEELESLSSDKSPSFRPSSSGHVPQILVFSQRMTTLDQSPVEEFSEQTPVAPASLASPTQPEAALDSQPISSVWEEEATDELAVNPVTEEARPAQSLGFSDVRTIVDQEPVDVSQPPVHETLSLSAVAATIDQEPLDFVIGPSRQTLSLSGVRNLIDQEPEEAQPSVLGSLGLSAVATTIDQEPVDAVSTPPRQPLSSSRMQTIIDQYPDVLAISPARQRLMRSRIQSVAAQEPVEAIQRPANQQLTFSGIVPVVALEPVEEPSISARPTLTSSGTQTILVQRPAIAAVAPGAMPPVPGTITTVQATAPARSFSTRALIGISALFVLLSATLVAGYYNVSQERALWLGANDLTRQSVVRLRRSAAGSAHSAGLPSGLLRWLFVLASGGAYGESMLF